MTRKTAAQQQIEALKELRQSKGKPAGTDTAPARAKDLIVVEAVEAVEAEDEAPPQRHLIISEALWQRLKERQARTREFKKKQEAGDWAAELLLNLPPGAHRLDASAKAALFALVDQWFTSRSRT